MGLLNSFINLLDEDSNVSFEKKMLNALDKVEHALGTTVDKAEAGLKKVDNAGRVIEDSVKKVDQVSRNVAEKINKDAAE